MENEAKADVLKGALFSFGDGSRLFKEIDVDNHGYISMEDILKFCQRENMELNYKDSKIIKKYLGLHKYERYTMEQFNTRLKPRDPRNHNYDYLYTPQLRTKFIELLHFTIDSFRYVEKLQINAANNLKEIKYYFSNVYKCKEGLTPDILKEFMFDSKVYSRIKLLSLSFYIFGEAKELLWSYLFPVTVLRSNYKAIDICSTLNSYYNNKNNNLLEPKKPSHIHYSSNQHSDYQPIRNSSPAKQDDCNYILLHIYNIYKQLKQKRYRNLKKQYLIEYYKTQRYKLIGLIKKQKYSVSLQSRFATIKELENETEHEISNQVDEQTANNRYNTSEDVRGNKEIGKISGRQNISLRTERHGNGGLDYEKMLGLYRENSRANYSQRIEYLTRQRVSSRKRYYVLNKASSEARMRIQYIEKKVLNRVHSRGRLENSLYSKANQYKLLRRPTYPVATIEFNRTK